MSQQTTAVPAGGSADHQAAMWNDRAKDWADFQEAMSQPLYDAVVAATAIGPGVRVLDVGCASGMFCAAAAATGARVAGIDATPVLVDIARARVPAGDFHRGDMEMLPYDDADFDVVTGFNTFQYAANIAKTLDEARRVTRPGGDVVIATWSTADEAQAAPYLQAIVDIHAPDRAERLFRFSKPRQMEILAAFHGLRSRFAETVSCPWEYPDLETALRGLLSAGPAADAIALAGEEVVRARVTEALEPFRTNAGGYRLENSFRYVVATAQ